MFGAILVLFFLPWLDSSKIRSGNDRAAFKVLYWLLLFNIILLGYLGSKPPEGIYVIMSRLAAMYYYCHFLVFLPIISKYEISQNIQQTKL